MTRRLLLPTVLLVAAVSLSGGARADDNTKPIADVVNIDATVTSDVVPDLAVVTLAIVREGPDVAPLTNEVNQVLAKAFAEAKATPGVVASNGGYSTSPRYDSRGSQTTRSGWQVRAQVVLKSKDFNALGNLVGRLAQTLQVAGSGFEISPELRAQENATLLDHAARAFQERALAATRAFGYTGYSIRQVTVGNAGQSAIARPMMMMRAVAAPDMSSAPLPIESGQVTLSLTVSGSLQLRK